MDRIHRLPKVDLHLHLDGSVKLETILELALKQGIELPSYNKKRLLSYMQVGGECSSLKDYLNKFDFTLQFLQTGEALERVAYEVVEAAAADCCQYIEVRFAPQLHRKAGMSLEEAIHYVIAGLQRGEKQFGFQARAIAICLRSHSHQDNIEVIEAAAQYSGKGLVAVDLAGDEASYPPELFREVFALSHKRGMPVTIHAGEAGGADNIYEAVTRLGATRIGHGVRLKENPAILEMVRKQQIPLEMCPLSNIQTKAVAGWEVYPIREYYELGLKVTVNTDNPIVSGTTLTKEYGILADKFGFTEREIATIIMNGVDSAFLETDEKRALKLKMALQFQELGLN
jgi:adenosine deaminase